MTNHANILNAEGFTHKCKRSSIKSFKNEKQLFDVQFFLMHLRLSLYENDAASYRSTLKFNL